MTAPSDKPLNVVILIYPRLCLFEFGCAMEVFAQRRPEFSEPHFQVSFYNGDAASPGALVQDGLGGLSLGVEPSREVDSLQHADLVIIPGWQGIDVKPPAALISELTQAHERGAILASICSGAFLLAYAGLLNARRATTHWRYIDQARQTFPKVEFDEAVLFIECERIITSAGSAAGLDMCLQLVRRFYGQHVANQYARRLLVPPLRDGGQAQFIRHDLGTLNHRFSPLIETIEANLSEPYSVQKMAELVHLSERHFLRKFKETFSQSPGKWLTRLRIQKACDLLESTDWPIKKVSQQTGLGSEENLRHHFRQVLRTSPAEYRATFGRRLNSL